MNGRRKSGRPERGPLTVAGVEPAVLAAVSVGGAIGALGRYGLSLLIRSTYPIPWATFVTNVSGCFAIGVLMVFVTEVRFTRSGEPALPSRLTRPFLGVGVLGGYTTFSTYAVEVRRLLESGAVARAFLYLGGSVVTGLTAVVLGIAAGRLTTGTARRLGARDEQ
ncbi:fluoride efflux transporter FluC [Nocardia stercoris]|uniref:Fluoride-specific ion channel FluC n=1 Tax=Nocardia stercoris TaxID=2483361 RepID=A0A3M2LFF5_9NOCA|nr:CrcB family protein [Nocardia stercoris]RMI35806.1 CrcB family protein [Nocardia stercoris]